MKPGAHTSDAASANTVEVRDEACGHGRWRLRLDRPDFAEAGQIAWPTVVFPREAVVITQDGEAPVLADANTVVVYPGGRAYRREPISERGDRCEWFSVRPDLAIEVLREFGGGDVGPERLIPFTHVWGRPELCLRQRRLSWRIASGACSEVERQEEILRLFRDAIAGGFLGERSRDAARASTRRAHRELASEARRAMGERLDERLTLESLARAVHSSPYHLSRVFRAETGWSVHGYLTQLRLAAGLDRLERGRPLSLAALEVGFSSHSHFTATFRRSFGVTPSAWRDEGSKRAGS